MSNKIRLGILGGGGDSLIGVLHRVAASMFDRYELVGGVFNIELEDQETSYLKPYYDKVQDFIQECKDFSKDYIGRESPLYFAERLTEKIGGAKIYFKRDD